MAVPPPPQAPSERPLRLLSPNLAPLALAIFIAVRPLAGPGVLALDWVEKPGYREAEVSPPPGRTGFTLLGPEQTGVAFTNRLSDRAAVRNRILENGSGVALGDVDGDGRCDIYLCQLEGPNHLYRNLGNWKFEDITASAGVACPDQFSTGAVFADIDGDGSLDLLVNAIGGGTRLFLNDGKGRFTEAAESGLIRRYGATSMALADIDGDGDLDLYVTNYRTTTVKDNPNEVHVEVKRVNGKVVVTPEDRFLPLLNAAEGVTLLERGEPDVLYINKGHGKFGPVSWTGGAFADEEGAALKAPPRNWGLSVLLRDLNGDQTPDIYVCNDFFQSPDLVWMNEKGKRFRAVPRLALRNMSMSSMSVDVADVNRDGWDDIFVADMLSRDPAARQRQRANVLKGGLNLPVGESAYRPEVARNTLQLNRGDGTYAEIAQLCGLEATEWTWSAIFLDVDLDGYEDLLLTTGNDRDVLDADTLRQNSAPGAPGGKESLLNFPRLAAPKQAYRNMRDLTFREAGQEWGFGDTGISHGMALADLDNDGDLDVVVNNLNGSAGIYRNNSPAPRVAVRLRGSGANTRGIGAAIRVTGGPVPQTQQMICGGRYLSGDDSERVFAAGTNGMRIEVTWRSGAKSVVENARANRIYEISEAGARPAETAQPKSPEPLFLDASQLLNHTHVDTPFNDFEREPLLDRKRSQPGPGLAWFDFDGDGWEDLLVGSGKGGRLAVFRNDQKGGFSEFREAPATFQVARDQTAILGWEAGPSRRVALAASSNLEDGTTHGAPVRLYDFAAGSLEETFPGGAFGAGPMAMADIDGDGDLDLFVGGRGVSGNYPQAAASRLYLNDGGKFRLADDSQAVFGRAGLVSGCVFADLNADGQPDLILACEWGPVKVFLNEKGRFREATAELGLAGHTGWWNGVAAGDFDGDGRIDFVASNWGRNTKYQRWMAKPLRIYAGAFNDGGPTQGVEAFFAPGPNNYVPWRDLDTMSRALPFVQERFATYRQYGLASVEEILGAKAPTATILEAATLDTTVFLNRGDHFEARPLPVEAQFAPAFGIAVADFDGDGIEDIFLAQNFFATETETPRYDAGLGLLLGGNGDGTFTARSADQSGLRIYGEQRGCAASDFDKDGRVDLAVGQNRAETRLYRNTRAKPGLRALLIGPPGNPRGVGASLRLSGRGPAREVRAGGGYLSQDSPVVVFPRQTGPATLAIRWPGGKETRTDIPLNATEISIDPAGKMVISLP